MNCKRPTAAPANPPMPERTDRQHLHARQCEFAAHLRDPDANPAPADVDDRRMGIYRDLFFSNVVKFLGGNFPVVRGILGEDDWQTLVRDYYRDHVSHSPLFPDMPREFLAYLADERPLSPQAAGDPPFLYELAHYEWVEAGLLLAPDAKTPRDLNPAGDLLSGRPVLQQPGWLLSYQYAVNEINADYQPEAPAAQPLHYLVYRNAGDEVKFVRLNIVSARLYELLQQNPGMSGREALSAIAAEIGRADPQPVIDSGLAILEQWRTSGIVLGTSG